jgi:4-amino-4-deoxychorismate lyase
MMLINGEDKGEIAVTDRGLQYGDGLFETIEVIKGRPIFLQQHLQRLKAGCLRLNIPQPNAKKLIDEIKTVCQDAEQAVLKLIITRGPGGRGYRQPDPIQPTRVISLHPFPEYPSANYQVGIAARFCDTRLGLNPALAGIKHLNRLEQILARAEWSDPDIQEGIMLDINDRVIEGTMTNLFYVKDGSFYTAMLKLSGVAGVMRGIILEIIAERNLKLIEHDYHKEDLLAADEAFVCNSIIGLWPIGQLEQNVFSEQHLTKQIQQWLMDYKAQELANAE